MEPYFYVRKATRNGESLLSLCCGIGLELLGVDTMHVIAVDVVPQYLEQLSKNYPIVKTVCMDALDYTKTQPDQSVDVISIIDGIEHMPKEKGLELITEMKRVGRKILLFTPEGQNETGYLKNEPHDAWGITRADEHQTHKSGWTLKELQDLGFRLIISAESISQHDEPYTALMVEWHV